MIIHKYVDLYKITNEMGLKWKKCWAIYTFEVEANCRFSQLKSINETIIRRTLVVFHPFLILLVYSFVMNLNIFLYVNL